jgi:hypothetical protein
MHQITKVSESDFISILHQVTQVNVRIIEFIGLFHAYEVLLIGTWLHMA